VWKCVSKPLLVINQPVIYLQFVAFIPLFPDDLSSWLELFQWIHTALYITASYEEEGEEEDVSKAVKSKAQDILTRWSFTPLYKDPAIISSSSQVMLFLKEIFFCTLNHHSLGWLDDKSYSHITVCV